jgi:hypothetical protein
LSTTQTSARPACTSGASERRQARSSSRVFHETTTTLTSGREPGPDGGTAVIMPRRGA